MSFLVLLLLGVSTACVVEIRDTTTIHGNCRELVGGVYKACESGPYAHITKDCIPDEQCSFEMIDSRTETGYCDGTTCVGDSWARVNSPGCM